MSPIGISIALCLLVATSLIVSAARRETVVWLAPDLAMTFALVTLLSLFFMFGGATSAVWRFRYGLAHSKRRTDYLDRFAAARRSIFFFETWRQPWVAWEWGADVLMAAVYRVAGLPGVALLYGLSIAGSVWMWFRLNRAVEGNLLLAGLFFVFTLPTTTLHWLARPHIFSWLFLLGTVWLCESMPRRLGWRHVVTLVFLGSAAWANLHASFFFAPVILLIYAAGDWLKPLIWEGGKSQLGADQ